MTAGGTPPESGEGAGAPPRETLVLPLASASRRLNGTVAWDLGIAILSGRHPPGTVLPGEIAAGSLAVSRTAYREAIRTLSAKGLVESRPKTGTQVSARGR